MEEDEVMDGSVIEQESQFLAETPESDFLTPPHIEFEARRGQLSSEKRKQDLKLSSGLSDDEIDELVDSQGVPYDPMSAIKVDAHFGLDVIQGLITDGATLEEIEENAHKRREIESAMMKAEQLTSVEVALAKDPQASGTLFRIENRASSARDIFMDKVEETEKGWAGTIVEFIDELAYDTYVGVRDIGTGGTGGGTELGESARMWEVAMRSYSDEEYQSFVNERLAWASQNFAVGGKPSYALLRELQAMDSAGVILYDEQMGYLNSAIAAVDLLSVGTLGASGVKAVSRIGKSSVGRLKSTTSIRVATEAAESSDLVKNSVTRKQWPAIGENRKYRDHGGHGQLAPTEKPSVKLKQSLDDAKLLDDLVPTATSSRVVVGASQPVSAGSVAQAVAGNQFIKQFLSRVGVKSFGTTDFAANAVDWAKAEAGRMAKSGNAKVIDFDTAVSGTSQAKASFTIGKTDGKPFLTQESAMKVAQQYPNSQVVPVKGATGEEFVVKMDTLVPFREGVEATDLNAFKARTRMGRFLGRADLQSSTHMSDLADAGDYGFKAFDMDFKRELKKINKLPKSDIKAIDEVLTALRDTPNGGNARTWLTSEDFSKAYFQSTGKYPSRDAIQAYETLVEMSDFSYYIKANERLNVMANQRTSMVKVGEVEAPAFPSTQTTKQLQGAEERVWVFDVGQNKRVDVRTLKEDVPLLELSTPAADRSTHVANFYGNTRSPVLTDALPYNAGGPRSNPDLHWFVGNNEGNWSTLLGSYSEKEALAARDQFNAIAKALEGRVGHKADDVANLPAHQKKELDLHVRKNNDWNPNIETIEDFVKFTKERGVPATKLVQHRGRGEKISSFIQTNDQNLVNLNLESHISYSRHDQALITFGGELAANPNPLISIQRQYTQMASRGAINQYRMNHPTAWVKAVEKHAGKDGLSIEGGLTPMTDEMKVRNMKITGNTEVARKLRQEQSVIMRRLDMFDDSTSALPTKHAQIGFDRGSQVVSETIYNLNVPGSKGLGKFLGKATSDKISNSMLSLGFFQKMASIDQIFLQASHFIAITAISPKNGAKGLQMATIIRQAAREGDTGLWKSIAGQLRKTSGLSEEDFTQLLDHMLDSGRGYMRGAVAEDPMAGMTNSILGKVKDITSMPYYAGENFQATLSRITAFLDTKASHPKLDVKSNGFWNAVATRDRSLSFALNKAQKSEAQSDAISRVLTQWSSYPLRTMETIFFDGNLTKVERARLAAVTATLWGVAGLGYKGLPEEIRERFPHNMLATIVAEGADVAFDNFLGIKIGDRLAIRPYELWERGNQMVHLNFSDSVPAATIIGDTWDAAASAMMNVGNGRIKLASHDLATLARTWKVVDSGVMAYNMHMSDVRRTKGGGEIEANFTTSQKLFQAIGVKPSQANDQFNASNIVFNNREKMDRAQKQGIVPFRLGVQAMQDGKMGLAKQYFLDANAIVMAYGLSDTRSIEVMDKIHNSVGYDNINSTFLNLLKDGFANEAMRYQERMN